MAEKFPVSIALDRESVKTLTSSIQSAFKNVNLSASTDSLNRLRNQIANLAPKIQIDVNGNSLSALARKIEGGIKPISIVVNANAEQVQKNVSAAIGNIKFDINSTQVKRFADVLKGSTEGFKSLSVAKDKFAANVEDKFPRIISRIKEMNSAIQEGRRSLNSQATTANRIVSNPNERTTVNDNSNQKVSKLNAEAVASAKTTAAVEAQAKAEKAASVSTATFADRLGITTARLAAYLLPAGAIFQFFRGLSAAKEGIVEIDRTVNKLTQVLDGNAESAKRVTDRVLKFSTAYGLSGREVLEVTNTLAQAGDKFAASEDDLVKVTQAIAKTKLGSTFGDMKQTTEGVIAALSQFNLRASDTNRILDISGQLAKKFAFESSDMFDAVRAGGGAFALAGGNLEEFAATITAFRQLTRLPAVQAGTAINTIALRSLRPEVIKFTEDLVKRTGGSIRNADGGLKSLSQRIVEVARATKNWNDEQLAPVIERLSDIRQGKFFIPLLRDIQRGADTSVFIKALDEAHNAAGNLNRDTVIGLQRIDVQLQSVSSRFDQLFNKLGQNQGIRGLFKDFADLAKSLAGVLDVVTPLIPALVKLSAIKLAGLALSGFGRFASVVKKNFFGGPGAAPVGGSDTNVGTLSALTGVGRGTAIAAQTSGTVSPQVIQQAVAIASSPAMRNAVNSAPLVNTLGDLRRKRAIFESGSLGFTPSSAAFGVPFNKVALPLARPASVAEPAGPQIRFVSPEDRTRRLLGLQNQPLLPLQHIFGGRTETREGEGFASVNIITDRFKTFEQLQKQLRDAEKAALAAGIRNVVKFRNAPELSTSLFANPKDIFGPPSSTRPISQIRQPTGKQFQDFVGNLNKAALEQQVAIGLGGPLGPKVDSTLLEGRRLRREQVRIEGIQRFAGVGRPLTLAQVQAELSRQTRLGPIEGPTRLGPNASRADQLAAARKDVNLLTINSRKQDELSRTQTGRLLTQGLVANAADKAAVQQTISAVTKKINSETTKLSSQGFSVQQVNQALEKYKDQLLRSQGALAGLTIEEENLTSSLAADARTRGIRGRLQPGLDLASAGLSNAGSRISSGLRNFGSAVKTGAFQALPTITAIGVSTIADQLAQKFSSEIREIVDQNGKLISNFDDILDRNKSASTKAGAARGASSGALGGGLLGAEIGTAIAPGIGTAIGAAIGTAVGAGAGAGIGGFSGAKEGSKAQIGFLLSAASRSRNIDQAGRPVESLLRRISQTEGVTAKQADVRGLNSFGLFANALTRDLSIGLPGFGSVRGSGGFGGGVGNKTFANVVERAFKGNPEETEASLQFIRQQAIDRVRSQRGRFDSGNVTGNIRSQLVNEFADSIQKAASAAGKSIDRQEALGRATDFVGLAFRTLQGNTGELSKTLEDINKQSSQAASSLGKLSDDLNTFSTVFNRQIRETNKEVLNRDVTNKFGDQSFNAILGRGSAFQIPEQFSTAIVENVLSNVEKTRGSGGTQRAKDIQNIFGDLDTQLGKIGTNILSPKDRAVFADTANIQASLENILEEMNKRLSGQDLSPDNIDSIKAEIAGRLRTSIDANTPTLSTPEAKSTFNDIIRKLTDVGDTDPAQLAKNSEEIIGQLLGNFKDLAPLVAKLVGETNKVNQELAQQATMYARVREIQERLNAFQQQSLNTRFGQVRNSSLIGATPQEILQGTRGLLGQPGTSNGQTLNSLAKGVTDAQNELQKNVDVFGNVKTTAQAAADAELKLRDATAKYNDEIQRVQSSMQVLRATIEDNNRVIAGIQNAQKNIGGSGLGDFNQGRTQLALFQSTFGSLLRELKRRGVTDASQLGKLSADDRRTLSAQFGGLFGSETLQKLFSGANRFGGLVADSSTGQTVGGQADLIQTLLGEQFSQLLPGIGDETGKALGEAFSQRDKDFAALTDLENKQLTSLGIINNSILLVAEQIVKSNKNLSPAEISRQITELRTSASNIPSSTTAPSPTVPNSPPTPSPSVAPPTTSPSVPTPSVPGTVRTSSTLPSITQGSQLDVALHALLANANSASTTVNNEYYAAQLKDVSNHIRGLTTALDNATKNNGKLDVNGNINVLGFDGVGKDISIKIFATRMLETLAAQLDRSDPAQAALADRILSTVKRLNS
jgi:TP901 family phage tail tape measure protein